jgi:hydroxymethylpyrimidine pyrophosphatase-like HAD family hydrolase/hypoxanthine phosphoribosyltransferase
MTLPKIKPNHDTPLAELECDNFTRLSEEQFYSQYKWCINPVLSLSDLFGRLHEELDRCGRLQAGWQHEECKINLYLFACAIACTVDDYLALPPKNLSRISERYPFLKLPVATSQWFINAAHALPRFLSDCSLLAWRDKWGNYLDQICELMAKKSEIDIKRINNLQATLQSLLKAKFSKRLLRSRMILPEGFRCQDLAHQDLFALIQQVISHQKNKCRFVIIGPRTFAAYFAPLVKAYLSVMGWPSALYMTVRPKWGISRKEKQKLRQIISQGDHVLIVDDYPNTGETLKKMIGMLRSFGVEPERISTLAPSHAVQKINTPSEEIEYLARVSRFTMRPDELYKEYFLNSSSVESLFGDYFADQGWEAVTIQENSAVGEINNQLQQHYGDGFHVRLKRVFDVRLSSNKTHCVKRVFAKSVGWGWLGYHAYLSGTCLSGFVPKVIGLRNGLLFTEWIEKIPQNQEKTVNTALLKRLSSYVISRVEKLPLSEDPWFECPGYRRTGWEFILGILRSAYGRYVDYVAIPLLKKRLRKYISASPTMVDGHMRQDEWLESETGIYKVDFEHHNFGGAELDMVDPAYDLASAIFEFRLSQSEEQELLLSYTRASGDQNVSERIMIHKLLYGLIALQYAAYWVVRLVSNRKKEELNESYLWARNFLIYQMNQFCARAINKQHIIERANHLFFLDIDGVLDTEILGFPHTTYSGLTALRLLQCHGFSIIPNSGRSIEHVKNYCLTYGLSGGIAEYGSIFWDAMNTRELSLIDKKTAAELARCREAIKKIPGVFIDPGYRCSIRAYRYNGQRTVGLEVDEVKTLLTRLQCDRLTTISQGNTFILQKGIDKGSGLLAAKKFLGYTDEPVSAIGDTVQDLAMLDIADFAYAPSNCSKEIYDLAGKGKCKIMPQPYQRGLLAAAQESIRTSSMHGEHHLTPVQSEDTSNLIWFLLRVAELPRLQQLLRTIQWSLFS